MSRPVPQVGEIALDAVQRLEHRLDAGYAPLPVAGLDGEVHQRLARRSHRFRVSGLLSGDGARDALARLQQAAAAGEELPFAADVATALELQRVVITSFHAVEEAGAPDRYLYDLELAESPPLPPPATVDAFGGLDDFGLGDLGIDPSVLGDIADVAGDIAAAVDAALDAVAALGALADLGSLDGLLAPVGESRGGVERVGEGLGQGIDALGEALG